MWRVPRTILHGRFMPPGRLLRLAVRGTDGALAVLLQASPSSSQACTLSVWAQVRTVPSLSAGVAETRVPASNTTKQMPVSGRELHTTKLTQLGPVEPVSTWQPSWQLLNVQAKCRVAQHM